MSLGGSKSRLSAAAKELALKWADTKSHWRDDKSREFEHRYIEELLAQVDKSVTVIDKLDEILTKVRKDCE